MDGDLIEGAGQLAGQRLRSRNDEESVRQTAASGLTTDATRRLSHGGSVGVQTNNKRVGPGGSRFQNEPTVTGANVQYSALIG